MNYRGGEVLPDWKIRELIDKGIILNADLSLVNPSSLDLVVGPEKYKLLGSFLPRENQKVEEALASQRIVDDRISKDEFYIDIGQPYAVKLIEELKLLKTITAKIHNKSRRGRVGISVKGMVDGVSGFNHVPAGYEGGIYAEICATSFPTLLRAKDTIPQIIFFNGIPQPLQGLDLELLLREHPILTDSEGNPSYTEREKEEIVRTGQFTFHADLSQKLLIYRAKRDRRTYILSEKDRYNPFDFFEAVEKVGEEENSIVIHPGDFVLVKSKEHIRLPLDYAAEISDYSPDIGDIRSHYAGWINAGHGYDPQNPNVPSYIVFEMRARDLPFLIQDEQRLAKFVVHRMLGTPEKHYMAVRTTNFDSIESILPENFKKR